MPRKVRFEARSLDELRDFLSDAEVDLGCRPYARRRGDRYSVIGIADDGEVGRLNARAASNVRIEALEELPPPEARSSDVSATNRFLRGAIPRGLARKE
jgi:hypothetical protein